MTATGRETTCIFVCVCVGITPDTTSQLFKLQAFDANCKLTSIISMSHHKMCDIQFKCYIIMVRCLKECNAR